MAKVRIKQVKSAIDRSIKQKRTLEALGLRKVNASVEHTLNGNIRGMITKVAHLVEVTELDQDSAGDSTKLESKTSGLSPKGVVSTREKDQVVSDEEE